jgi:predicted ferric reductase
MLLALTVIGGTIWHILPGEFIKILFPIISISVWSITTVYRLVRIRNHGGYISSYNSYSQPGLADPTLCATKFTVRVRRHLDANPGEYVYLYFSGMRRRYRFQGHPFMIAWREYDVEVKDGKRIDVTNLIFLVQPRGGLTARLGRELELSPVSFEGPYGQDLHLERYEMVMLVAKGIGIAGVLPYAQHLAERNRHDGDIKKLLKLASTPDKGNLRKALYRDATRKVDLFWKLDLNRQEEWVSDQLNTLQDMDPGRASLHRILQIQANSLIAYELDILLLSRAEGFRAVDQT